MKTKKSDLNNFIIERHTNYLHYVPEVYHHCLLSNFDFSDQHESVKPSIQHFLETPTKGLYLYGDYGVGKSHLLVALYRIILAREGEVFNVLFISFEKIMKEYIIHVEERRPFTNYLDAICNVKWLFLDDLTAIPLKDYTVDVLRKIINTRYEKNLISCFTANCSINDLAEKGLQFHAASRLNGMCTSIEVSGHDRRK